MSVDLRGFDYGLEPVRQRRQWQLDAALARLGKAEAAVRDAAEALEMLRATLRTDGQAAGEGLGRRLDPYRHRLRLARLTQLRIEIEFADAELDALKAERMALQAECRARQRALDVIEAHRAECIAEYACDEARRQAIAADRDWLARATMPAAEEKPRQIEVQP